MPNSTLCDGRDGIVAAPASDRLQASGYPFGDDEIPDAPEYWTLEDFRDILAGLIQ